MPGELAPLIEGRLAEAMRTIADESIDVGGGVAGCSGPGSWSNQAVGMGFAGEVSAEDVAGLVDFHVVRGAEPKVEVAPHAHSSLVARLREARFVVNGFEQVLVRPIGQKAEPLPDLEAGIALSILDNGDPKARRSFLDVQTRGFRSDDAAEPSAHDLRLFPRYLLQEKVRAVVALIDAEPAGVGLVSLDPPICQLFGASTRPGMRGRGVQRALIIARLKMGAQAGCTIGNIDSAAGGGTERNAVRMGFMPIYTRVSFGLPIEGTTPSP